MSSTPHDPSSHENRVNEAIAAYLQAVERGENSDREKFLAEHADVAVELKSFFINQAEFQQAVGNPPPVHGGIKWGPSCRSSIQSVCHEPKNQR
jgi:hypothetical protein